MARLELTLACGTYDRTIPLQDGSVTVDGVSLNYIPMRPGDLFRRQARYAEFDVAELSFSTFCMLRNRGDDRMVAIPVFPSRKFRHSHIFINDDTIQQPSDLIGKDIGAHEYQNTASSWIRGILSEHYGVRPNLVRWHLGGINAPKAEGDRIPLDFGDDMNVTRIGSDRYLSRMLADGEIAAVISAERPDSFVESGSTVRRLFPNYPEVEREYFEQTRIFPIMHTVVIKREIYEKNRWLARSLYEGFNRAKAVGNERLRYSGALFGMVPWLGKHIEDMDAMTGGQDLFEYGIDANRHVIERFSAYSLEQGLTGSLVSIEDLFVPETLQT